MLTSNPGLDGIRTVWDVPAKGVIATARAAGPQDLVITTTDQGENVAICMAQGGSVYGLGAQRPYHQGVTEALLAGYDPLDKEAHAFIARHAPPVSQDNLLDAWQAVYAAPANARRTTSMPKSPSRRPRSTSSKVASAAN